MEVGNDEVSLGQVNVHAERSEKDAGEATDGEQADKAEGVNHRVSKVMEPFCSVKDQLKILIADGTATSMVSSEKTSTE